MRIKELKQRKAELVAEAKQIFELAGSEGRALTDVEKQRDDAIAAELETVGQDISREERQLAREKELTTMAPPSVNGGVTIGSPRNEADPMRGFARPADFCLAVMNVGRGRPMDERLLGLRAEANIQAAAGSDEHGGHTDPYGAFLVPEGMSPDMLSTPMEADPIAGRVRGVPMTNPTVRFNARVDKNHQTSVSGGLTVTRREETGAGSDSRMEFEQVVLQAYSLFGLAYVTQELLMDSPISFAAMLAGGFSDEFASKLIDERLNGTGVGEFLGIMNSGALVTVSKEAGPQTADTIVYENAIKMRSRCWGYQNAIWLANHDTYPQLAQMEAGSAGYHVYHSSIQEDRPDLLLGRPIFYTEYCQTLGDLGDIVLVNWREYLEGTLESMKSAESVHVRFVNHESTFKFWIRNAGAPWWRTPLTPKNSANTLSPYVTLEAR